MNFIGVDLGTSAVKLLMMNEHGEVKKIVSKEYPIYTFLDGFSEQDPNDWWNATKNGLKEITENIQGEVTSISFSGQMHGLVILDEKDEVIRRAILWNDQRTQKQCDFLNNNIGRSKIIDETANVALTGFTAPKILWLKENEPESFNKMNKIMLPKDYIAYKLTGVHASDYSDASGTLLLDVKNKKWSSFMLETIGINEKMLPTLYNSFESIGNVLNTLKEETGLTSSTKVVIGGGDQAVGAVGTSAVASNMCSISLGTSGVVFVSSDNFNVDYEKSALHSFCHANGKFHMMGVTLSAAASNKWWMEEILKTTDNLKEQSKIELGDLGENDVYFLPYLSGERTPHNDANARGAFIGMSISTTREKMTQAVLEGVAFSLLDTLEIIRKLGIEVKNAKIIGGGAKSEIWCQICADTLNVTIEKINSEEGPALGAAILAAVGVGQFENVDVACEKLIKITKTYIPRKEVTKKYIKKHETYKKLYKNLKDSFVNL